MQFSDVIRYDTNTWVVLRNTPGTPEAVVQRVTDTGGEARYLLLTWALADADRRMVGIHTSLRAAVDAVPWPRKDQLPDGSGHPPGVRRRVPSGRPAQQHRGPTGAA
ncbi:hypothetical protein [Leucobacter luti]|uniref:Uncharacterized protein n=1 Tax=Leucobacter luti TaxID=340320 RepID=A0A4Q7TXH0_9MICO|nr:hypothetical protein [Leucobacter luti]MBL3698557.1 hypothetical protein [Leucobacter luti]RZT65931.1 hypothetical protein EV139_1354 [Leucobacter luti]